MDSTTNLSERLTELARTQPDKAAVVVQVDPSPRYRSMTYRRLEEESNRYARGLIDAGLKKDDKAILMVKPSIEFFSLTSALLKMGAVLVMIDPGMGKKRLVSSLGEVEAKAFIGTPLAHVLRILSPSAFRTVELKITTGAWGGKRLKEVRSSDPAPFPSVKRRPEDTVGIFFTSGSTGPPKGVVYEHSMFDHQIGFLKDHFGYEKRDVDLATFPLFALFDANLGLTSVIPYMDATKPGKADPKNIVRAIEDQKCTNVYGSPALLTNLARYGIERKLTLGSVRRIVTAGAPIRPDLMVDLHRILPKNALIHTPYGATEALPVTDISSDVILEHSLRRTETGAGTCVGRPLPGNEVRIIRITDGPVADWGSAEVLPDGEVGEICVRGPSVTKEYFRKPEHTKNAKILDGKTIWHRMGDTGYLEDGMLWFCGRKAHRVVTKKGTLYPVRCEAIFNKHPLVFRSALVGVGQIGNQRPVIVVELKKDQNIGDPDRIKKELLALGKANILTEDIRDILIHDGFPMDVRHNAKILREELAEWAGRQF
ncbi:MAG: fatty acid CoA ligase family protein [Candidatus Thermoplasmatota archaeon]|nr:fatty acid CoA ligase family protein [Candidatus Thermoplasmatota archaeon]